MALTDLRVPGLTRILDGSSCTMLLADLGADVVKIEPPGGGNIQSTPPYSENPEESYNGYFQSVNRGKQNLELDLTQHDDHDIILELADDADVIAENYRAGTMEWFGLGYERLRGSESEGKATAGSNTPDQVDPTAGQQEGISG